MKIKSFFNCMLIAAVTMLTWTACSSDDKDEVQPKPQEGTEQPEEKAEEEPEVLIAGYEIKGNYVPIVYDSDSYAYVPDAPAISEDSFKQYIIGSAWQTEGAYGFTKDKDGQQYSEVYNTSLFMDGGAIVYFTFDDSKLSYLGVTNPDGNEYRYTIKEDYYYDAATSTMYVDGQKKYTIVSLTDKKLYLITHSSTVNQGRHLCTITPMHPVSKESVPTDWLDQVPVTTVNEDGTVETTYYPDYSD